MTVLPQAFQKKKDRRWVGPVALAREENYEEKPSN